MDRYGYKGGKMNIEDRAFEKHCSDNYFYCPLCEEYHEKLNGSIHSLCQMPVNYKGGD